MTTIPQNTHLPLIALITLAGLLGGALGARMERAKIQAHVEVERAPSAPLHDLSWRDPGLSSSALPASPGVTPGATLRHERGWTWRGALPRVTPLQLPDQLVLFNHHDYCAGFLIGIEPQTGEVLWSWVVQPAAAWCVEGVAPAPSLRYDRGQSTLLIDWAAGPKRYATSAYPVTSR